MDIFNNMGDDREKNIIEYFQAFKARMKTRERLSQTIVDKYQKEICFVIKKEEIWMEAVVPRIVWVTEMGYDADENIIETYAKALLEAPREPEEEVFGNAETIESKVQTMKQRKRREKTIRKVTKHAK